MQKWWSMYDFSTNVTNLFLPTFCPVHNWILNLYRLPKCWKARNLAHACVVLTHPWQHIFSGKSTSKYLAVKMIICPRCYKSFMYLFALKSIHCFIKWGEEGEDSRLRAETGAEEIKSFFYESCLDPAITFSPITFSLFSFAPEK